MLQNFKTILMLTLFGVSFCQVKPVVSNLKPQVLEVPIKTITSPSQYYAIAQSKDNWVVILYEKWCGYSQVSLKMLEELRKNKEFIKTQVKIILKKTVFILKNLKKLFLILFLIYKLRFFKIY